MGAPTTSTTERPMFLSADKRSISYKSKNGNTITLELKNSKAADRLHEMSKKNPLPNEKGAKDVAQAVAEQDSQGLWPGLYDALSFWAMEAMEIACFGPYDECKTK